jgi:hypothetical protein
MKTIITSVLTILLILTITNKTKAQAGAALNFDGINDEVIINNSTLGALTIEFWMRTTQVAPTGSQWHFGNGLVDAEITGVQNDFGTALLGSKLALGIGNPDITLVSTSNVNTGNWVHVAVVYTSGPGKVAYIYINGILEASSTAVSGNARNTNGQIAFGRAKSKPQFYNGDLDEVRIWNYTRTQCQIQNNMFCELTSSEPGLLYYYQFNQGIAASNNSTVTTITNLMGGNNGAFNNFTQNGATSNFIAPGAVVSGVSCNPLSTNVQGNGNNIMDNATTTSTLNATNYGTVCTSAVPLTNIFTIQNNGTAPLTMNTFTLTGANATSFSVSSMPPTSLAVGSTATFAVTFSPSTSGAKVATIAFNTSDCAFPTYNFALSASVIAAPTIAVNSGSICSGNSFVITPSGATTYSFSGGTATVSPSSTTIYTVVGTGTNGCPGTNTALSTVNVIITPTLTLSSGAVCNGQSFTLSPIGASTYTYLNGGPVVTPSVSTSYSVIGSNGVCISSNTAVATISVNSLPTISVNSGTVCSGNSFTLSPSGASTYTFVNGGPVITPTANGSYSVLGSSAAGCAASNTAIASLSVIPGPSVNIVTSNSILCVGQSATLSASGAVNYTWSIGMSGPQIIVSPTTSTTYSIYATNSLGCSNSSSFLQSVSLCTNIFSQENNSKPFLQLYPNPTNKNLKVSLLNLEGPLNVVVYDCNGKVCLSKTVNNESIINVDELKSGLYFVVAINANLKVKFIKN